jgi:hypothetical protein
MVAFPSFAAFRKRFLGKVLGKSRLVAKASMRD